MKDTHAPSPGLKRAMVAAGSRALVTRIGDRIAILLPDIGVGDENDPVVRIVRVLEAAGIQTRRNGG